MAGARKGQKRRGSPKMPTVRGFKKKLEATWLAVAHERWDARHVATQSSPIHEHLRAAEHELDEARKYARFIK